MVNQATRELADFLYSIGWSSPSDAQLTQLNGSIAKVREIVSFEAEAKRLREALEDTTQLLRGTSDDADEGGIASQIKANEVLL